MIFYYIVDPIDISYFYITYNNSILYFLASLNGLFAVLPRQVLMEALCGHGFTILLAAISPALRHVDETANTLSFAARCGRIEKQLATESSEVELLQREVKQRRGLSGMGIRYHTEIHDIYTC